MRGQSRRVALCGVLCALAEVFLLLGGLVPAALYACPILAMLALLPAREECGVRFALVSWAAVGLLALLLCPDKELAGVYLALGWYPPLQGRFEAIRPKLLRAAAKLFANLRSVRLVLKHRSVQQAVDVKSRAARNNGCFTPRHDIGYHSRRIRNILRDAVFFGHGQKINHVVAHASHLIGGRLCGSNAHPLVYLHRIG